MTNLENILKSRDITLPTKACLSKLWLLLLLLLCWLIDLERLWDKLRNNMKKEDRSGAALTERDWWCVRGEEIG